MSIKNLQSLIAAREKQMGGTMIDHGEPNTQQAKESSSEESEVLEILGLIFRYIKETTGNLQKEINGIKANQQEILELLKKDEE